MSTAIFRRIADELGVSPNTVQRALTKPLRDTRPTIVQRTQKIRALAQGLNYRPNAAAVAVATGRFNNVSLLLGGTSKNHGYGWMPRSMLSGISDALGERDMTLSVAEVDDDHFVSDEFMPRILRQWCTDGLLINYIVAMPPRLVSILDRHRIPTVWTNVKLAHDCVYNDDVAAGRMATASLRELGHTRIAFLGRRSTPTSHYSEADRLAGYTAVMQESGLAARVIEPESPEHLTRPFTAPHDWLNQFGDATAAVVYHASDAVRLWGAAQARGLAVPGDLSMVTFTDDWNLALVEIPFTAIAAQFSQVGRRSVGLLSNKIEEPGIDQKPVAVEPKLMPGFTVGPPRSAP